MVQSPYTIDSSRPAVLSLTVLFALGIYLLTQIEKGRRVAQAEDAAILGSGETG